MSRSKPLAYQSAKTVLEHLSFGKRKHLYAMCPTIRKMEEILPYNLESVILLSFTQRNMIMEIDSVSFIFRVVTEGNQMRMLNNSTKTHDDRLTCLAPEQAAEKCLLYHLSREGTRLKNVDLTTGSEFISKCVPIAIKNLISYQNAAWFPTNIPVENVNIDTTLREDFLKMAKHVRVRIPGHIAESFNTEIVSEWNCEFIKIDSSMYSEEIADYCNKVSKRTDRPIGSFLMARHTSSVEYVFNILYSKLNARKTVLHDRQCATIAIDESTELNVYRSNIDCYFLVVEVCARGTTIDQAF